MLVEATPGVARPRGERVERCGCRVGVVVDRELTTVAPVIAELRVESDKIEFGLEARPGKRQDLVKHVGQREERRADVEREAVALERCQLAASDIVPFEDRHGVARSAQSNRCGQPTDTAPDNHHVLHVWSFRITAAPAIGSMPSPPTNATSGSRKYFAKPSVSITDMYA